MIDDSKSNTIFDKPSFYEARDFSYYLLLDSDILESIVDLNHKEGGEIQASLYVVNTNRNGKGHITYQVHLADKLINKV